MSKSSAPGLKNLHRKFGYKNLTSFIVALKRANGVRRRGRVTAEKISKLRQLTKQEVENRKIAKILGLSIATVHLLKHEHGLAKKYRRKPGRKSRKSNKR